MLISSSTVQGRLTWPLMQYSLVPLLLGRPRPANQSGPRRRMVGLTATVSTLVTVVGQPYRPTLAGNGGLRRGLPCEHEVGQRTPPRRQQGRGSTLAKLLSKAQPPGPTATHLLALQ
jgi:hypothetical protein